MKQQLYSLGKQTLVYGISAAALQVVGVITLPIFARTFSPGQYGALEIVTVGTSAMLMVADMGMTSASQRSYFDYPEGDERRRTVLATALAMALTTATALAVGLILFRRPLADWLFDGKPYGELVVLGAIMLPVTVLATLLREVMRLRFMAWSYSISAIAGAVVAAALSIWLVLGTHAGMKGVLIGALAGNGVAVLYGLAVAARFVGRRLSWTELRIMLAFGLPLIPAATAMWGLAFLDRVMLSRLASLDEVGQYAVGARFASVLTFVVSAFGLAYMPFLLSLFAEDPDTEKQVRSHTLTYLAIVLTGISLVLALFARELARIVAPGYTQAYRVVGVLCLGATLYGLSTVVMAGISLARRTGFFTLFSVVALVANVVLNIVLIPPLGGLGAALATAAAYGLLAALYYRTSQAVYPTPYDPRKTVAVLIAGAALMPLGFLPEGLGAIGLKVLGLIAFVGLLVIARVLGGDELAEMRSLTRRLTGRAPAGVAGGTG